MDRIYCTLGELMVDLEWEGVKNEQAVLRYMRSASQFLEQRNGNWTPRAQTLKLAGRSGWTDLLVPPLLAVTTLTNDGVTLTEGTDFVLAPNGRHWESGPYSAITLINGGAWSEQTEGVIVNGLWGLYDRAVSLGAEVTTSDAVSTGLAVGDGSKVSPGMVLKIEDEQMLVEETSATVTDSTADLNGAITADDVEITLTDGTKVSVGETIKVGFEQMLVQDVSGNDVLVLRGYNQTTRAAHLTAANVYAYRTFTVTRGANGTTAAMTASGTGCKRKVSSVMMPSVPSEPTSRWVKS